MRAVLFIGLAVSVFVVACDPAAQEIQRTDTKIIVPVQIAPEDCDASCQENLRARAEMDAREGKF
jgi:hypothetical protein